MPLVPLHAQLSPDWRMLLRMRISWLSALVVAPGLGAQEPPMRIDTEVLKPGVWVFRGFTNGNVLALETPEGVVLTDAQSAKRVASLDSALRRVTSGPVRWVVNTHYHEDHTG